MSAIVSNSDAELALHRPRLVTHGELQRIDPPEEVDRKGRCGYFRLMSQEDAKRFREQADECRQQAATAVSLDAAEVWLRLAGDWMKLAEAAEKRGSQFDRDPGPS